MVERGPMEGPCYQMGAQPVILVMQLFLLKYRRELHLCELQGDRLLNGAVPPGPP